jgi:Rieske Fe-S protein
MPPLRRLITARKSGGNATAKRVRFPWICAVFVMGEMPALIVTPSRPAPAGDCPLPPREEQSGSRKSDLKRGLNKMDNKKQHAAEESGEDTALITRRRFLGYGSGLLSALIGAALGLPLIRFYVGNTFKEREYRWLKLGPVESVTKGQPKLFRASHMNRDGWRQTTRRESVYAVTQDGENFATFSNACTHLGCPVYWDDNTHLFLCPCHNGGFSIDGKVVKGPAPKPLDSLEHKVEGGILYVQVS